MVFGEEGAVARERAIKEKRMQWRVSTPLFAHVEGSKLMTPLGPFRTPEALKKYPEIISDDYYTQELNNYSRAEGNA